MSDSIVINGGNVSIQISGGGPGVAEIQAGLATAAALATLQDHVSGTNGIESFPAAAAAANGVSLAEVVRYIQEHGTDGILAALGTLANTGGTATLAAMIGDPANNSLVARLAALATSVAGREQQVSVNAPNHIAVTVDMTNATWNTVATHEVFHVTGAVRMRMWIETTGPLQSAEDNTAFMSFGTSADPASLIPSGVIDGSLLGLWVDVAGYSPFQSFGGATFDRINHSLDIGYQVAYQIMTGGTLIFHCVWEPLSAGATVVAGAGGPL